MKERSFPINRIMSLILQMVIVTILILAGLKILPKGFITAYKIYLIISSCLVMIITYMGLKQFKTETFNINNFKIPTVLDSVVNCITVMSNILILILVITKYIVLPTDVIILFIFYEFVLSHIVSICANVFIKLNTKYLNITDYLIYTYHGETNNKIAEEYRELRDYTETETNIKQNKREFMPVLKHYKRMFMNSY